LYIKFVPQLHESSHYESDWPHLAPNKWSTEKSSCITQGNSRVPKDHAL